MSDKQITRRFVPQFLMGILGRAIMLALIGALPAFAGIITVMNTNESGAGSLRQAIADANPAGGDTIDFGVTGTITLTSGEIQISKSLTITGPGATLLAISGNNSSRVFNIDYGIVAMISGVTIENGTANYGGGILSYGTLTLTDTALSGNAGSGGGIANWFGMLTVNNCTFSSNVSDYGGAIKNHGGTLTVTNSSFYGNAAYSGAGIQNEWDGTLTVTNSTFSGNRGGGQVGGTGSVGGGIYTMGGIATVTNTTITGNSVGYRGGGLLNYLGTVHLTNCTISGNSATFEGGGVWNGGGTFTLKNTILTASTSGGNCYVYNPTLVSQGHNLSDDDSCSPYFTQTGDLNNTPAILDPVGLRDNGGPTQTIALLQGSPAVDAIQLSPTNCCTATDGTTPITTDQRGVPRPQGSGCDIGAYEGVLILDNQGPITTEVQANPSPVAVNTAITLTARVDDTATGGSNIASAEYTIDGGLPIPMNAVDGTFDELKEDVSSSVAPFAATGVFTVCVKASDVLGNEGNPGCVFLPVYNPTGGFVTGGGIVNSPAGADRVNSSAAGPATFGFVSKYLPGRSVPDGNLEFQFKAGDLNFKSKSMDWLVVTGEPRAQFQGTGTINGTTECKFAVDAWDGSKQAVDAFGMKIFSCGGGGDRYDLPATPLMKGSIIIHH